jgi:hypothetical protein
VLEIDNRLVGDLRDVRRHMNLVHLHQGVADRADVRQNRTALERLQGEGIPTAIAAIAHVKNP